MVMLIAIRKGIPERSLRQDSTRQANTSHLVQWIGPYVRRVSGRAEYQVLSQRLTAVAFDISTLANLRTMRKLRHLDWAQRRSVGS